MFEWYQNLSLSNQAALWFIVVCYCLVMFLSLLSFLRFPFLGWYRGFQSTPIFQILMWLGALPLLIPAILLYLRRRRALKSVRYIGNLRSRVFHYPHCEYQRKIYSSFMRYPLNSTEDALKRRFRPCRWCKPQTSGTSTWEI